MKLRANTSRAQHSDFDPDSNRFTVHTNTHTHTHVYTRCGP